MVVSVCGPDKNLLFNKTKTSTYRLNYKTYMVSLYLKIILPGFILHYNDYIAVVAP